MRTRARVSGVSVGFPCPALQSSDVEEQGFQPRQPCISSIARGHSLCSSWAPRCVLRRKSQPYTSTEHLRQSE